MIALFFVLLLSIFSFYFKKSKILFFGFFILMWLLFGWNFSNADLDMYKRMYSVNMDEYTFFKIEGGYSFLMYCCRSLGLSFQQFLITISAFILLSVFRFFYLFSAVPALLITIFFWFFFPLEYVLLRNFLAFSIVLFGLIPVFQEKKFSKEIFVFFVFLASTVHISSLMYLIFLFAFKGRKLKIREVVLWVFSLLILVFLSHKLIFSFLSLYSKEKVTFYYTSVPLFLFYSFIQIVNLLIVKYFLNLDNIVNKDGNYERLKSIILNVNIVMLLLIVVYYEMAVFVRILLNMSIVNLVFITNKTSLLGEKKIPKFLFFSYLLFGFYWFIFLVKEETIFALFDNNLLFK